MFVALLLILPIRGPAETQETVTHFRTCVPTVAAVLFCHSIDLAGAV